MDCHDSANANSLNDGESIDCHANPCGLSRNDGSGVDSHKSQSDSRNDASISSLRGHFPKQSTESHEVRTESKSTSWHIKREALFAKKCDLINKNNLTKSWRNEEVENIESLKDSIDSAESTEDSNVMDLQVWVSCGHNARHDLTLSSLTITKKDASAESTKMDSHDFKNANSPNGDSMEIPQQNIKRNGDFIALIPAYKPTHSLITLAHSLLQHNFIVIVVNDGSPSAFDSIFTQLPPQAILLKNAINLGKGAALKNGINYAINHFPDAKCIITLDCDGQHSIDCVLNLRDKFIANGVDLAIGTRGFKANVPLRSKFGNNLTAFVFRVLFGKRLQDTQSGLRAFSIEFGKKLLPLSFNGYEFEMQMLILACNNETKILQVPIRTIYIDNNASSHFNPIFDSLSIYCVLFRHIGNSLLTALIDYVVFVFSFAMGFSLFACMISGRIVAGSFNFIVGKNFVFKSKGNVIFEIVSYVLLTLFLMLISMKSIAIISTYSGISEILVKPFCEAGIFAISFLVQRFIIFSSKAKILDENRGGATR